MERLSGKGDLSSNVVMVVVIMWLLSLTVTFFPVSPP